MAIPPRATLVSLTAVALTVIAVVGGILPQSTVPLPWYVPALDLWILLQPTGGLKHARRTLTRALALTMGGASLAIAAVAMVAPALPAMMESGRFTLLNTFVQAMPLLVVAIVAAIYRRGRNPDRRVETAVITGLVLVTIEAMTFMFMRREYDGYWYLGHGLLVLPYAALFVGALRLLIAARREAEVQLRVVQTL